MTHKITFTSLGPGDAELITIKGLRSLQSADAIFCPQTLTASGITVSRSKNIVHELGIDMSKVILYDLPMSNNRTATIEVYRSVANQAVELHAKGQKVVITSEGDSGFYSSSQYINEFIMELGVETVRISGVSAFIECSSLANIHAVNGENSLEVIPYAKSCGDIERKLETRKTLVFMKLSQSESTIREFISKYAEQYDFHYFENVGIEGNQYYSSSLSNILTHNKFPYYSILIIK